MPDTPPDICTEFLPRSFTFSVNVHCVVLGVARDVGRFVFLQHFEVAELVQTEQRDLPQPRIEQVAFVNQHFAPDHLVARGGVARKIEPANKELLALVHVQRKVDLARFARIRIEVRLRHHVQEAELAVQLAQLRP